MRKLIALLLVCLALASTAHAQSIPDQRPLKGNVRTRGLNIATYLRNGVNVLSFGAVADNKTDNTAAFNAAFATGFPVYVPEQSGCFAVNNLSVPNTSVMFGDTGGLYADVGTIRSCITGTAGASVILNPNGNTNQIIENIDIIGNVSGSFSTAVQCIAGGSTNLTIQDASIRYCGNGGVGDTSNITHTLQTIGVYVYGNGASNSHGGLENLVDSHIIGGYIAANYYGIDYPAGANNNTVSDAKIEFNNAFGENFQTNSTGNVTLGGICDNNAFGCQSYQAATHTTTLGTFMYRNGRGVGGATFNYGQQQQVYFSGGASDIVIDGCNTQTGKNDDGSGTLGPPYTVFFNNNNDQYVSITNCDLTGNTNSAMSYNLGVPTVGFVLDNNQGVSPAYKIGENDLTGEVIITPLATPSAPVITHSGTSGAATWTYKVVARTSTGYNTAASPAGSTTSGNATLTTGNFNIVTITPVNGAMIYDIYRTAVGTSPTTTGKIGSVNAGVAVFNDTGGAGDSSTAPTTNTTGVLFVGSAGVPTCGTGCASITTGSTDYRGSFTSSSSVSSVALNFSTTLLYTPTCVISDSNTSAVADISSITSAALTVSTASALTAVKIYYICTP